MKSMCFKISSLRLDRPEDNVFIEIRTIKDNVKTKRVIITLEFDVLNYEDNYENLQFDLKALANKHSI